jgi:hypothetical protein
LALIKLTQILALLTLTYVTSDLREHDNFVAEKSSCQNPKFSCRSDVTTKPLHLQQCQRLEADNCNLDSHKLNIISMSGGPCSHVTSPISFVQSRTMGFLIGFVARYWNLRAFFDQHGKKKPLKEKYRHRTEKIYVRNSIPADTSEHKQA